MKSYKTRVTENKRHAYKYIDLMRPQNKNCIKLNANNTDDHEFMKFQICRQLNKEHKEFITECIFKNNRRADIVVLDDLKIIEILCSETTEQCKNKIKHYPDEFEIIMVNAKDEFNEKLIY